MELYDEVSGRLVPVAVRPRMSVYVCGITPYDSAHLGHAFTYVHLDVLVRYLRYLGADVVHVQNVTDVDDDILRVAREGGIDYRELAGRENARFVEAMRTLGVGEPTQTRGPASSSPRSRKRSVRCWIREEPTFGTGPCTSAWHPTPDTGA